MVAMLNHSELFALYTAMGAKRPLVQNITNYVAMAVSANVLLAAGASPAMVHAEAEVEDFAQIGDTLVINIGTLSPAGVPGMVKAAKAYTKQKKPFVFDPVGVGATQLRNRVSEQLLAEKPVIIRGNASEIATLAGQAGQGKGADSTLSSSSVVEAARTLALQSGAVIAMTGEVDYVTDGTRMVSLRGGHALMPLSTALGCSLSALVAAFAAVAAPFEASLAALAVYKAAGKLAGERVQGPGHLPAELCDRLYALTLAELQAHCQMEAL